MKYYRFLLVGLVFLLLFMTAMLAGIVAEDIHPGNFYQPVIDDGLLTQLTFVLIMTVLVAVSIFISIKIRDRFIY